jgi:hypothetical protein
MLFVVVGRVADDRYEIIVDHQHAVLHTTNTQFRSTGEATLPVVEVGTVKIRGTDGFEHEWPWFREASSENGASPLSFNDAERPRREVSKRIEAVLRWLATSLIVAQYTDTDKATLARRLNTSLTAANAQDLSVLQEEVDYALKWGYAPLHYAIHTGDLELVHFLLDNAQSPLPRTRDGLTATRVAIRESRDPKALQTMLETLMGAGASIDDSDDNGQTPLLFAICNRYDSACEVLVKLGANVNATDSSGETALHITCQKGGFMVSPLVALGANPAIRDKQGRTPADMATLPPPILEQLRGQQRSTVRKHRSVHSSAGSERGTGGYIPQEEANRGSPFMTNIPGESKHSFGHSSASSSDEEPVGKGPLTGIWTSATGARCRFSDDGTTVAVSLLSSTRTLREFTGKLTRRNEQTDSKFFDGMLDVMFVGSSRRDALRTAAVLDDADHLRLRFTDWPTYDRKGKRLGERFYSEVLMRSVGHTN